MMYKLVMSATSNEFFPDLQFIGEAGQYAENISEVIDRIVLFDDFSEEEVQTLSQYMTCYAAPANYMLLKEGDRGDFLLLLLSGGAVVKKQIEDLGSHNIADIGVGSILGEMSLIDGHHRFASCVTTSPTNFAVLTRSSMNQILTQYPRLGNKFLLIILQMMAARVRASCDRFLPAVYGQLV